MMTEDERKSQLVNRLRGVYHIPVRDGAGPLNGSNTFTREFKGLPPIYGDAANMIEALERGEYVSEHDRKVMVDRLLTEDYYMGPAYAAYVPPILEEAANRISVLFPE
jgi:hypothetical protein